MWLARARLSGVQYAQFHSPVAIFTPGRQALICSHVCTILFKWLYLFTLLTQKVLTIFIYKPYSPPFCLTCTYPKYICTCICIHITSTHGHELSGRRRVHTCIMVGAGLLPYAFGQVALTISFKLAQLSETIHY